MLADGLQSVFVGQSAALTASVTGAPGGVSYRWQKWYNGAWTNTAATSTTHSVSSATTSVNFYRFRVSYPSGGGTAASGVLAVQWRPMRVSVSASPEFPLSASTTRRTVTLTATSSAPSGVSYQWQQDTGSGWTDLGAKTTSSTRDVSFTTRGTRKFRVVASHATASSATSSPVYVTWDEWAIVAEMIGKLSDAVATSTTYKAAQTALSCMNGSTGGGGKASASSTTPTYESFDDILAQYATTTKAKMDGECAATSTTMFNTNQSTTRAELAKLKAGNTVYATLLDTPQGRLFDANVGDASRVRLDAYLIASQSQNGGAQQGAGGQTDPVPPTVQPTGLGCVPIPVPDIYKPGKVTFPLKLAVLNCLVVSTPYSFWTDKAQTDELKGRIDDHYTWLGYDSDWGCSPGWLPDSVPNRASCLRHDVAYGSLVEFVPKSDFGEVDMAWNPRNRFLADELFSIDLACGSNTRNGKNPCERLVRSELTWKELELNIAWLGSSLVGGGFKRLSDKLFGVKVPVTELDIVHARSTPRFVQCYMPSLDVTDVRRGVNQRVFVGEWTFSENSCTGQAYSIESVDWHAHYSDLPKGITKNKVAVSESGTSSQLILNPWEVQSLTGVELRRAYLEVEGDVNFGGRYSRVAIEHAPTLP